jgi:hypothetical protein
MWNCNPERRSSGGMESRVRISGILPCGEVEVRKSSFAPGAISDEHREGKPSAFSVFSFALDVAATEELLLRGVWGYYWLCNDHSFNTIIPYSG